MQDLETGIQKLKDWAERLDFTNGQLGEIIKLFEQAKDYQEEKNKRSIVWSIEDFIIQAMNNWENTKKSFEDIYKDATCWQDVYDETKFQEQLYAMVNNHDAEYGVSWETINFHLDEYCLKNKENDTK